MRVRSPPANQALDPRESSPEAGERGEFLARYVFEPMQDRLDLHEF